MISALVFDKIHLFRRSFVAYDKVLMVKCMCVENVRFSSCACIGVCLCIKCRFLVVQEGSDILLARGGGGT